MIAWLLACGPEAPPAPHTSAPEPTGATTPSDDCPQLDWVVQVGGGLGHDVLDVAPLPGGDVLVSGYTSGGVPIGTRGRRLPLADGARDGFVARLGPDGAVRWAHVMGGTDADQLRGVQVVGDRAWLAGDAVGPLSLDGERLDDGSSLDSWDAWGMSLLLDSGEVGVFRRLSWPDRQEAWSFAGDDDGNTYLTGIAHAGTLGFAGSVFDIANASGLAAGAAVLLSWDAQGRERWQVAFTPPRNEGVGEVVSAEPPLWAASVGQPLPAWSGGAHPALPEEAASGSCSCSSPGAAGSRRLRTRRIVGSGSGGRTSTQTAGAGSVRPWVRSG